MFENFSKLRWGPIEVLHLHDQDALKGVDGFLSQLPLGARESVCNVYLYQIIKIFEHANIGEEAIMRGFSYLRFGVAEVDDHGSQQFGLNIKFYVFGVQVDDL